MKTGQAGQLDVLLSQCIKVLNQNCDTEETDVFTTFKRENRCLSPFDNNDTQKEIVMAEKKDNSLTTSG